MKGFDLDSLEIAEEVIIVDKNKEVWTKVYKRLNFLKKVIKYRFKSYTIRTIILDVLTLFFTSLIIINILLHPWIIVVYLCLFFTIKLNKY